MLAPARVYLLETPTKVDRAAEILKR